MVIREIFGRVYVYCTKMELPDVVSRIREYTMVFVVTSVTDLTDLFNELRERLGVSDDLMGKFIIMRKAEFVVEHAQEFLEHISSELMDNLKKRAEEHIPLMPFQYLSDKRVRAKRVVGSFISYLREGND